MLSVQQVLSKNSMTLMAHPPYSPDLTPGDIFLLPRMKKVLKGKHFAKVEEVKQKMVEALEGIKTEEFKNCSEQWKKTSRGVYCIRWRIL